MSETEAGFREVIKDQDLEKLKFFEALVKFILGCQRLVDAEELVLKDELLLRNSASKYIAIDCVPKGRDHGRVYAFVVRHDGFTKQLGQVKSGDVLKPASWSTPAKNARGNIFDEHGGLARMSYHGPGYDR